MIVVITPDKALTTAGATLFAVFVGSCLVIWADPSGLADAAILASGKLSVVWFVVTAIFVVIRRRGMSRKFHAVFMLNGLVVAVVIAGFFMIRWFS